MIAQKVSTQAPDAKTWKLVLLNINQQAHNVIIFVNLLIVKSQKRLSSCSALHWK